MQNPNLKFKAQIVLVNNGYVFEFETGTESQSFVAVNNEELAEVMLGCLPREWSAKQITEEIKNENGKKPEPKSDTADAIARNVPKFGRIGK